MCSCGEGERSKYLWLDCLMRGEVGVPMQVGVGMTYEVRMVTGYSTGEFDLELVPPTLFGGSLHGGYERAWYANGMVCHSEKWACIYIGEYVYPVNVVDLYGGVTRAVLEQRVSGWRVGGQGKVGLYELWCIARL